MGASILLPPRGLEQVAEELNIGEKRILEDLDLFDWPGVRVAADRATRRTIPVSDCGRRAHTLARSPLIQIYFAASSIMH